MSLFLIALVPEKVLKLKICHIKENFAATYEARHALKLPPHITLIPPFKMDKENETSLDEALVQTAVKTEVFNLELDSYGCFSPRVIFIKVVNSTLIKQLYHRLYKNASHLLPTKPEREFYPHITIATRDLSEMAFKKAMPVFKEREFRATFPVHSIVLFRHNGKTWEIIKEMPFKGNTTATPLS